MIKTLWTGSEIAAVTGGRLVGDDFAVTGISTDTRSIQQGDLFLALKGPRFDGNEFAADALKLGAVGVVTERDAGNGSVIVADTMRALQDMGKGARARSKATIIAVTGSVGKTSAKSMLAQAFARFGETHAAEASLNNHWGVPLSLARLSQTADYAVFEIGMNHANEISPLSKMVTPHIALITAIAPAHIEFLKTIENIALAKSEIFHGMDANGIAILPRDSEQYSILLAEARTQGIQHIWTFGEHEEADVQLMDIEIFADHSKVSACIRGRHIEFKLGVPGRHQAMNALAVLAAIEASGHNLQTTLEAFAEMKPVGGRGNHVEIIMAEGQAPLMVIDETHNASPIAVEAALKLASHIQTKGRRILVLGDMLELGIDAPALHAGLAPAVMDAGFDHVFLSGPLMAHLAEKLPASHTSHFPDSAILAGKLAAFVQPQDVVLVKGSRGSKMKLVVDALGQLGQFKTQP